MHEMALCRNVVDMVLEEADKVGAQRVSGVYLTVGYSRDIVESLFDDVFKWLSRDTKLEGASLYITRGPFTVKCLECGYIYHVDVHDPDTLPCPKCGKKRYTLHSGMEFFINDIEVVMPSEPIKEQ